MDIRQLRYFIEVLEAGSLRKAADHLRIAQTALGRQVRLLESEFGKKLILRHSKGISPTPAGQRLQFYAHELLQSVDDIHRRMAGDEETLKGRGMLGVPTTIAQILYGAMAERLAYEQPEIEVGFVQGNAHSIWAGLEAEDIDLGILIDPERQDGYEYEILLEEQMYLLSRGDLPNATDGNISATEISHLPLIVYRRPTGPRKVFDRAMSRFNVVPNIAYEIEAPLVAKELVSRGLAYAIVSTSDLTSIEPDDKYLCAKIENLVFNRVLVRPKKSRNQPVVNILSRIAKEEYLKFHDLARQSRTKAIAA